VNDLNHDQKCSSVKEENVYQAVIIHKQRLKKDSNESRNSAFYRYIRKNKIFDLPRLHPDTQRDLIVLQITGQLFFIVLFFLSLFYWRERQAFDAAHYLFEIIDRKFFFVAHQRPIGIVSQVLPVIGVWLHLPLKVIAILYSLGDILWYYLLFIWIAYGLKSRRGIIALLLILSLTVRYSFFCPVTELLQGLALLPVWLSLLNTSFRFRTPVLLLILSLMIFSHPLLFYPAAFGFLWWQLNSSESGALPRMIWPAFAVIVILKFLLLDTYDHDKTFYPIVYNDYGYLKSMSLNNFFQLLTVIATHYPIVCLLFTGGLTLLLIQKKWKQAALLFLACTGYIVLILATHRFGAISNYSERMLLPLPAMLAISVSGVISITRQFIHKLVAFTLLVLILLLHFDVLRITSRPYTLRVEQINSVINAARQLGIQKGIVKEEWMEQTSFAMTGWSYSMESLWISALDGPDSCVTIAMQRDHIDRIKEQGNTLRDDQWVMWAENIRTIKNLNQRYFRLRKGPYLSLYDNSVVFNEPAGLSLVRTEKINHSTAAIAIEMNVAPGKVFYCNDSSFLQVLLPEGPELRLQLPYHIKGINKIWLEIPFQQLPADAVIEVRLLSGNLVSGALKLKHNNGQFWEEK